MSDKESHQSIPVIDWSIKPGSEVLDLEDLADIQYIPLETTDSCLIDIIGGIVMGNNRIAFSDLKQQCVFIFDTNGHYVGRVNHRGSGPEDYPIMNGFSVDFNRKEVYIYSIPENKLYTYDFDGNFKHKCTIGRPGYYEAFYNYNDSVVIAHDMTNLSLSLYMPNDELYRYITINKQSGAVTPLPIRVERPVSNTIRWRKSDRTETLTLAGKPIMCDGDRIVISDYACDTIFELGKDNLNIIACQTHVDRKRDIHDRVQVEAVFGNLLFLEYIRVDAVDNYGFKLDKTVGGSYMFNSETNELKRYSVNMPFLKLDEKPASIENHGNQAGAMTYVNPLYTEMLMDQAENDNLKGPLAEIVKNLDEDSNPVLMIASFKR